MSAPTIVRRTLDFHGSWLAALKSRLAFFGEMRWQELSFGRAYSKVSRMIRPKEQPHGKPATSND
jgi:hypothetical protein